MKTCICVRMRKPMTRCVRATRSMTSECNTRCPGRHPLILAVSTIRRRIKHPITCPVSTQDERRLFLLEPASPCWRGAHARHELLCNDVVAFCSAFSRGTPRSTQSWPFHSTGKAWLWSCSGEGRPTTSLQRAQRWKGASGGRESGPKYKSNPGCWPTATANSNRGRNDPQCPIGTDSHNIGHTQPAVLLLLDERPARPAATQQLPLRAVYVGNPARYGCQFFHPSLYPQTRSNHHIRYRHLHACLVRQHQREVSFSSISLSWGPREVCGTASVNFCALFRTTLSVVFHNLLGL